MRLKKLDITGFKTFREKTALDLAEGITCIVGPNGCGKSNIVDAMRWVMGEQRIKTLRGKKMEDVIFNGARGAAPVGMAEVVMTLAAEGAGFAGIYAQCSEVTVARKIFRDGESEYSLNGVPCRLLDVREFFMGTGVGARTYSLVEQNSIATLIEAKPEERRLFIEEAAGVSKYKSRKEAAMRKMEQTQQNLLRVNDIAREVKSRLNLVSRQAKKAEQYKALKQEIRESELMLARQLYTALHKEDRQQQKALDIVHDRQISLMTLLDTGEAKLQSSKAAILDEEAGLSQVQESLYELRSAMGIKEQAIRHATQKAEELTTRKLKDVSEIERIRAKHQDSIREFTDINTQTAQLQTRIEELQQSVSRKHKEVEELKHRQQSAYCDLDEKKIQYVDIAAEKAKLQNMLVNLQKGIEDLRRRDERDRRELAEHNKRREDLHRLLEKIRLETDAAQGAYKSLSELAVAATDEQERLRLSLKEIDEEITAIKEDMGRKSARLASLKELQERYEGCQDGVRSLMIAEKEAEMPGLAGDAFCGLVADHMGVPQQFETAVESVLGEKLQYVIVKNQEDGIRAIDYLKHNSLGRGSFVPLEMRQHEPVNDVADFDHLKGAIRLADHVEVEEDYKGIANYLLGDVLLIPNLLNGVSLWKQNGFRGTFVTPDGDLISPQGVLTGGKGKTSEMSPLRNRREIGELRAQLAELEKSLQKENQARKITASRIIEWEEESRRARLELHRTEMEIAGKNKDTERFEDELKRLEQRIRVLDFNCEQANAEESDAAGRLQGIRQALVEYAERERSLNEGMKVLQAQWEELRAHLEKATASLTSVQVLLGSAEEKKESNAKTRERILRDQERFLVEMAAKTKDIQAAEDQVQLLNQSVTGDRDTLAGLYRNCEQLEASLTQRKDAQRTQEMDCRRQEAQLGELKKSLDLAAKEIHALELSRQEILLKKENLRESIHARYGCDLDEITSDFQSLEPVAAEALEAKLDKDKRALEHFGEVNLLALGEYEDLKQRFEFLTTQAEDLQSSIETLKKTIARINAVTRERFAETFAAINVCFRDVFARIFPGGSGELRLTDETDMLETGVDIDIQVPGKKAQSISLLSGGEKSLAAIALIFAIILYRPTPFLILDEVDASLDDANIVLFNRLLKDTSASSQIIMITHNKRSMEAAGRLIGVTMQNEGISSIVSVSLN